MKREFMNNDINLTEKIKQKNVLNKEKTQVTGGFGQYHTANPTAKTPKPYIEITLEDITSMVKNPNGVPKENAPWVIFSSWIDPYSRQYDKQRGNGIFHALWADLDEVGTLTVLDLSKAISTILPKTKVLIYNTSSATPKNQKARIILPLDTPCSGKEYAVYQRILNDKLEAAGIEPDRANERVGQICYLPNRGKLYAQHITVGNPFDLNTWATEKQTELQKVHVLEQEIRCKREQALKRVQERINTGQKNPIQAYKDSYPIETALSQYGYITKKSKWVSPLSESGTPGVSVQNGKIFSHHQSDSGIGHPAPGGGIFADAFDLFVFFEHGGNFNAAVRAAGEMFTITDPVKGDIITINKFNQREMMRQAEPETIEKSNYEVKKPIPFTTFFDICQEPMTMKYIADGFIAEGDQVIFTGDGGIGKSMLSLYIGYFLAMGKGELFDNFPISKTRSSLFLNSENSKIQVNARLNNMAGTNPEDREPLKRLYAPVLHDNILTTGKNFDDADIRQWVIDLIHQIEDHQGKLDLLWIDPLISFISCDENAAAEMRKNLDGITEVSQACKVTPIVIHHNKKDGNGYRGSSAIRDWTRNLIELDRTFLAETRITNDNPVKKRIAQIPCIDVKHKKCNNFAMFDEFTIRMMHNQKFRIADKTISPDKAEQGESIVQALTDLGGEAGSTNSLTKPYREITGVGLSAAKNHIKDAVANGFINRKSITEKGKQTYVYSLNE